MPSSLRTTCSSPRMLVLRWRPDFSEKSVPTWGVRRKPIRWKSSALGVSSCCAALRGLLGILAGSMNGTDGTKAWFCSTSKPGRDWVDPDVHCPSMCQLLNVNLGAHSPCRFPDLRDSQRSRTCSLSPKLEGNNGRVSPVLAGRCLDPLFDWALRILLNQLSSEAGPPRLLHGVV